MISVLIRIAELLQCLDQQSLLLHKLRVLTIVLKVLQVSNELNFVIKEDGGDLRGFVRIRDKDLEDVKGFEGDVWRAIPQQMHDRLEIGSGGDIANHQ